MVASGVAESVAAGTVRVLMIEDNPADASALGKELRDIKTARFDLEHTMTLAEGLARLEADYFDVLLLDLGLPDSKGQETIRRVTEEAPDLPVVVLTVSEDETLSLNAISAGVQDCFVKGTVDERLLARAIRYAIHRKRTEVLLRKLNNLLGEEAKERAAELEGRKLAEIKLSLLAVELERSNKELEHFASVASHDLQEPLRTVAGFVQLLRDKYGGLLDDKGREYLSFVLDGTGRMQALVHDLLSYCHAGTEPLANEPVDVRAVVDRAVADLRLRAEEAGAEITVDPLPTLVCDAAQLAQLYLNLIGNAIKYHREGCRPEIHVGADHEQGHWRLWVKDNGIGIDPRFQNEAFTIFRRLHNREKYPGTGVGLAICKKVVERHGGKIWVVSQPGQGSTFFFTIPDNRASGSGPQQDPWCAP
jgi:signal transduction histidine kinase